MKVRAVKRTMIIYSGNLQRPPAFYCVAWGLFQREQRLFVHWRYLVKIYYSELERKESIVAGMSSGNLSPSRERGRDVPNTKHGGNLCSFICVAAVKTKHTAVTNMAKTCISTASFTPTLSVSVRKCAIMVLAGMYILYACPLLYMRSNVQG